MPGSLPAPRTARRTAQQVFAGSEVQIGLGGMQQRARVSLRVQPPVAHPPLGDAKTQDVLRGELALVGRAAARQFRASLTRTRAAAGVAARCRTRTSPCRRAAGGGCEQSYFQTPQWEQPGRGRPFYG